MVKTPHFQRGEAGSALRTTTTTKVLNRKS